MTKSESTLTPRAGWGGAWDRWIGPGATAAERWLQLLGGLVLAGGILWALVAQRAQLQWSMLQWIVVMILALDLSGGILTNATSAAKRWYHRPGQTDRDHLLFVAVHALHPFLVAWLFRGMDWLYFGIFYGYLLGAALVILWVSRYLRRATALLLFCGALLIHWYGLPPTPGLVWFVPFFFLKLLVSHLVDEQPFAPEE